MRTSQCFVRALPSNLIRLLATLLWLLSASTVVMAQVPATERTALVNLYNNTNGSNWNDSTNWLGSAGTECTWSGVTCDDTNSNVIGISLSNNNLVGTLPDLSGLTALQSFAVNSDFPNANQLGGPIPALSALTGLQDFEVNGNQLTGSIPSLGGLTSLTLFSANDNQLTGSIPDLSGLTALQTFTVNGNFFTSAIPSLSGLTALQDFEVDGPPAQIGSLTGPIPSLGGLPSLVKFSALDNQLTGSIPDLSGLTALRFFLVSSNQLTGAIPDLSTLTALNVFEVSHNQLTGSIPSLSALAAIQTFSVDGNQLTGSIPDLSNLSVGFQFNFSNNQLTGPLPSFSNLPDLQFFYAHDNQLSGPIPSLTAAGSLKEFGVAANQLTGSIPSLSGLTVLHLFSVDNNQLTGTIPSLSGLTALNLFAASHNQLSGPIPSLSGLPLQTFQVNSNQLSGSIPSLSGITTLLVFDVAGNQLTGSIPSLSGLTTLQFIDVGSNQLSGPLPSLSGLVALQSFGARANQLTGPIPSLTGLTALHLFGVDTNQLTGSIPNLSGLTALQTFDVAANQLTGLVPSLSGLSALNLLFIANNQLSGPMALPPSPSALAPGLTNLCANQLQSTGNSAADQAWDVASNSTPVNGTPGWLACQSTHPTRLAVISVNGGTSPTAGASFSVVIQAQDGTSTAQNVVANTTVQLSRGAGTGTLAGTLSCQINAGSNSCTIAGVTYSIAESGVIITATAISGDSLTAANSASFTVNPANVAPAITSAASATFTIGTAGTFTATATGTPAPTLSEAGALPSGVTFNAATGVLSGTPAAGAAGTYPITFTAANGVLPNATQSFTLTVNPANVAPAITSAASATFTIGTAGTFTATATGTPAPTLSEAGALPSGVTFNAATGVLSGTPAAGAAGTYPITFTAANGVLPNATQSFTLTVNPANVAPAITSAASATFTIGTAGTFTATATGTPAPTLSEAGALPSGVTFNAATGVLSGTPAAGAAGTYPITFTAANGVLPNATQSFTLTVNPANVAPTITSAWNTTFTVGTPGSFTVTSTGTPTPTLSESGTLPSGVIFNAATGVLSGTPVIGSAGTSIVAFTASNGIPPAATQSFTLTINPANVAPAITSAASATFKAGVAGTFTITATGTPSPTLSEVGALPSGVTFNAATGVLSGTPALGTFGSYPITFTATSGVVPNATQAFTLTVTNPAPVAYAYLSQFGSHGTGNGQFSFPTGVAIDPTSHHIVVLDNTRVEIFDSTGVYLSQFGSVGYQFGVWPAGVAIDPVTHNIVVVDQLGEGVRIYSPTGTLLTQFGSRGTGNGQFSGPSVVAIDPVSGNIIVGDFFRSAQIFSSTGVYLSQFVGAPSPLGLTIDPANHDILIAGQVYSVVEVFDPAGNYLRNIGSSGAGNGQFRAPAGVGIDPITENIVVADYSNYRVQILDTGGDYLGQFGSYGTGNGQFSGTFGGPIALAIDPTSRNVVVADIGGNRIEIFTPTTISLAPNGVAFGNAAIGVTSAVTPLTLTNIGTTPLTVSGIAIVGSNIGDFGQTNTCGGSVGAGASCTINVTFTPQAAGPRSASIQITDSAAGSPRTVPLSGTGVAIVRFGGSVQRALEDQAGNLYVSLIVTNQGNSTVDSVTVNVNGTSLSGPSFVFPLLAPVTLSANLAPGASETFNLVFRDNLPCQLVAGSMTVSGTYVAGAQNGSWKMSFRRIAPGSTCP